MFKKITKYILIILIMIVAIPVFAKELLSVEKITGKTSDEAVVLNAADAIDLKLNDLNQKATYKIKLKNNTDKDLYINDIVTENISEEFIDFSLSEDSINEKVEPGKTKEVEVIVKTLDITHAGRNVDDEVTLKFLLGDKSIKNPETSTNMITYILLAITLLITMSIISKNIDKKKKMALIMLGLLCGTLVVSANDSDYVSVQGKVKYTSQNLLQESGTTIKDYTADYTNSSDIWKYAEQVKNIIILDSSTKPEEYEKEFDLTTNNSKRIMGYLVENKDSKVPYDLYVVSHGVMYAPENSTGLFSFPNVETIKGLEFVEFDNTTNMTGLFFGNSKLKSLNLKDINTSNVTNTSYMFNGCDKLDVNENDLDLSKVTDKTHMYATKLTDVIKVGAVSGDGIHFSQVSSNTNEKGLYYTNKKTQDNKTTYYFRGAVDNNYVKLGTTTSGSCTYNNHPVGYVNLSKMEFTDKPTKEQCEATNICYLEAGIYGIHYGTGADEFACSQYGGVLLSEKATYTTYNEDIIWRIVRINEDGSVRLITEKNYDSTKFNSNNTDNAYVGYMYGTTGSNSYNLTHENKNDSTIKSFLDNWYKTNLLSYSDYMADAGFCGDRTLELGDGTGTSIVHYFSHERLNDLFSPEFKCNNSNDLYTLKTSEVGNKSLDYPIGLISADEVTYAGGFRYASNATYYLNNEKSNNISASDEVYWWTMTPAIYGSQDTNASSRNASTWCVGNKGTLTHASVNANMLTRPVINIKGDLRLVAGNGTANNPYVVKTN